MNEEKTETVKVYKLGRTLRFGDEVVGCLSYLEVLESFEVRYIAGAWTRPTFPAFAFTSLSDLRAFAVNLPEDFEYTCVWEAETEGTQAPPHYILDVEAANVDEEMAEFWRVVREGYYDPRFNERETPPGTVLCDSIKLVRMLTLEEVTRG